MTISYLSMFIHIAPLINPKLLVNGITSAKAMSANKTNTLTKPSMN